MANENPEKFYFIGHFLNREFVGQKALNEDNQKKIAGETLEEFINELWMSAASFIKREVLVNGDNFVWAEAEKPTPAEIDKFIALQDQGTKKVIPMAQVNADCLRKLREKHVNVFVYSYGKAICNKTMHTQFLAKLILPEKRDRANADNTVSVMNLVAELKKVHGSHYLAHDGCWLMWANHVQTLPADASRDRLKKLSPPQHLAKLFSSIAFSDTEKMLSARNGLRVTDNMIDTFKHQLGLLTKDFQAMSESISRCLEMMSSRLKSLDEVITSNQSLVAAMAYTLRPTENETSQQQEDLIVDCEDVDHAI